MEAIPEIFVDRLGEVSLKHGMIRIELVSLSGAEPKVTHRLIMSLPAFMQMLQAQHDLVKRLEQTGAIRAVRPPADSEPTPDTAAASLAPAEPARR
jgi:hypothetical protein